MRSERELQDYDGFKMAKLLIESKMQMLEDNIMPQYPEKEGIRPKSSLSTQLQPEAERETMSNLVQSANNLASSVREVVKKTKKIKTFLGLTRDMVLKNNHLGIFKNDAPLLRSLK